MSWIGLYLLFLAALLAATLTPLMRRLALRWDWLDHPGPRKGQSEPIPYLGGLAVFGTFALVVGIHLGVLLSEPGQEILARMGLGELFRHAVLARERLAPVLWMLLGGLLCAALGLADDRLGPRLPAWCKLAVQVLAAAIAVAAGARTSLFGLPWINVLVSVMWIVAITNAINFIDNMDGLAAGIVVISGALLWAVAFQQGQFFMEMILLVLVGSVLGFLPYNFSPASIYLGDAGSLFLGYTIGVLTTLESYVTRTSPTLMPALLPLMVLSIPVFDMVSVILIRFREGRPLYVGDRCHLSHRLVGLGMTPRAAVWFLYVLAAGLGIGALLLPDLGPTECLWLLLQWVISLMLISVLLFFGRKARAS